MRYRALSKIFPDWMWHLPAGSRRVSVTFDDGPHPETTPQLLNALERAEIPSTMFLTGERCRGNETLVLEISRQGHAIANHGYAHRHHALRGSAYLTDSIRRTDDLIRECGVTPLPLFRPPFGSFNPLTQRVLKRLGYRGVIWSLMIGDWKQRDSDLLWNRLRTGLHEGMILVLHDGHPTTHQLDDILPRLSDEIRSRDWSFTTLSPHPQAQPSSS